MPDDVADEKVKALHALGAEVERVRPASIVDKKQASNFVRLYEGILDDSQPVCCKLPFVRWVNGERIA